MNEPDREILERFRKRFSRIDGELPSRPPDGAVRSPVRVSGAPVAIGPILAVTLLAIGFMVVGNVGSGARPSPQMTPPVTPPHGRPSPVGQASPALSPSASVEPTSSPQRIDVVNHSTEVVVSVSAGAETAAWIVPAGATLTLWDDRPMRDGGIEIADHTTSEIGCQRIATATFLASSFTIVLSGSVSQGSYRIEIEPLILTETLPKADYTFDCSG